MQQELPILYSFRRCPYAIRARLAIIFAQQSVDLIEIDLKNKLDEFVALSPKATVPVLKLNDREIIDESLDIMQWAFDQSNPQKVNINSFQHQLIVSNDHQFKEHLDHYKYADRFPEQSLTHYQQIACHFPSQLNSILQQQTFLTSSQPSNVDLAIFPFIRQFSFVDKEWFDAQDWPHLQHWLAYWLEHKVFQQAFAWGRK